VTPLLAAPVPRSGFIRELSFDGRGCALFSGDRAYRYALTRTWDGELLGPTTPLLVIFVGLNPSKAGANPVKVASEDSDQTITKEMGFASRMGATAMLKLNLYGIVSTDPRGMATAADPIGPHFDAAVTHALLRSPSVLEMPRKVVVAWGAHPMATKERIAAVTAFLPGPLHCLGTTKDGAPRHPCRIAYSTPLQKWERPT
jgi:hypothetical protein